MLLLSFDLVSHVIARRSGNDAMNTFLWSVHNIHAMHGALQAGMLHSVAGRLASFLRTSLLLLLLLVLLTILCRRVWSVRESSRSNGEEVRQPYYPCLSQ